MGPSEVHFHRLLQRVSAVHQKESALKDLLRTESLSCLTWQGSHRALEELIFSDYQLAPHLHLLLHLRFM